MAVDTKQIWEYVRAQTPGAKLLRGVLTVVTIAGVSYVAGMFILAPTLIDAAGIRPGGSRTVEQAHPVEAARAARLAASQPKLEKQYISSEPAVLISPVGDKNHWGTGEEKRKRRKHRRHKEKDLNQVMSDELKSIKHHETDDSGSRPETPSGDSQGNNGGDGGNNDGN